MRSVPAWWQPAPALRWSTVAAIVLVLFFMGVYDDTVFGWLNGAWQKVFAVFGLQVPWQGGFHYRVTRKPLLSVSTYAAFYLILCLVMLRLLLPTRAQWRLSLRLYAGVLTAYVLLVALGKLAGNAIWAYRLSRHLLDFVISPLSVGALLVLFKAGFGPTEVGVNQPTTAE